MEFVFNKNGNDGRFTVFLDDQEAGFIKFTMRDENVLVANGTLVHENFRSQRLGQPLFEKLIDYVKDNNFKIYPTCPFVVKMIKKSPELHKLLAEDYQFPE